MIHKPEDCSVTASQVAAYLAAHCVDVPTSNLLCGKSRSSMVTLD